MELQLRKELVEQLVFLMDQINTPKSLSRVCKWLSAQDGGDRTNSSDTYYQWKMGLASLFPM